MKHLFAAALSALVISTVSTAFAQSMSGVSVGGDRQQLDSIGRQDHISRGLRKSGSKQLDLCHRIDRIWLRRFLAVQAEANVLEVKIAMDQEVAIADVSPANPVVASSFL
ncbi:hypothetical protein [Rhizobium ruizarguesonis]|uniref:hypothetical protein n=1 Tax=Rhizobium ruizarguesonis TaxID=2081791 RepID=UPI0010310C99|nr:hypothetical protein [Rhizobium ruizarguesonis]TBD09487.1 hypothetical protein ELH20_37095 [Rhizobium ruizarguesonis]TBD33601.1 hypothetical protein ELH17_37225 [Rhizobium ruizarguesonis]TBD51768.1 hypothetical protein ELH16_37020 [Rhizobium ruizarguesonis]TBF00322.1 hypothetical protein ELG96_37350 [Rhizobium ruizarguesonis]